MNDEIKKAISVFAQEKLCYIGADFEKNNLQVFSAFNVEKMLQSSNSGDYKYSTLATLGDSVAGLLLCSMFYQDKRKGKITNEKLALQNKIFSKVSNELGLLDYRYDDKRFGKQPAEAQFKSDPSALFEAVLGAIFIDCGYERTKEFWDKTLYPLIKKIMMCLRASKSKRLSRIR